MGTQRLALHCVLITHTHTRTHTQGGFIFNAVQGEESAGVSFRDDLPPLYGVENLPESNIFAITVEPPQIPPG